MPQRIIIDPPVGPFSPLDEIHAWLRELEAKRVKYEDDDIRETINRAIEQANRWLELRREQRLPGDPPTP